MKGDDDMKITVIGRKCTPRDSFKRRAEQKLQKAEKFFGQEADAKITVTVEKNTHIVEITIVHKGVFFRAQERAENMNEALDRCVDSLIRQIRKNKTKVEKRLHESITLTDILETEDVEEEKYEVIRSKEIALKPQNTEEAILQMNLLGHKFYMFLNSENGKINVIYARNDGGYGLIIPEID